MAGDSGKVVFVAFTMNLGIALAKFIGFFFTGSTAILAEAIHSVADSANQIFLFIGMKRSHRKPDSLHPFGYGMEQYVWSFVVAIFLFSVGGIFSTYEGIHKLIHPGEDLNNVGWILIMLAAAVAMETYSCIVASVEMNKTRGKQSLLGYLKTSKDQVLVTVIFEDYAALVGLFLASVGLGLYMATGNLIYDAMASISIGILLLVIAFFLYRKAKSLLVGEAASLEHQALIRKAFENHPKVTRLNELLTMHLSANQILVNAHVKFTPGITLEEVEKSIDEIEDTIVATVPEVFKIFIETHQKDHVEDFDKRKTSIHKPVGH
jgi:cation diffusion facilitator family transporter